MTRSRHTDPPWKQAVDKAKAKGGLQELLPRIVQRRPRPGDVVPIGKSVLRKLLLVTPGRYYNGLKQIEFVPRKAEIGNPFAYYATGENRIVVFSLPLMWPSMQFSRTWMREMTAWGAEVTPVADGFCEVLWPSRRLLSIWFYDIVFNHELGHHYHWQYRPRHGGDLSKTTVGHELFADMHRDRLLWDKDALFDEIKD